MKRIIVGVCGTLIFCLSQSNAEEFRQQKHVAPNGSTVLELKSQTLDLVTEIKTHEIQISSSDDKTGMKTPYCTGSRTPCLLTDEMKISINNNPVFVRPSILCELPDLNTAEVVMQNRKPSLILTGGDASEAYKVKIDFDATGVQRVIEWSLMDEKTPLMEIQYHHLKIGD